MRVSSVSQKNSTKYYESLVSCQSKIILSSIYMQSHKAFPRWLVLFGTMLMILSYNKVLLSVLILLASSLWRAQMETGSEGITRCASSVVYRQ